MTGSLQGDPVFSCRVRTLERELVFESSVSEVVAFVRASFGRMAAPPGERDLECPRDLATFSQIDGVPSVIFNGAPLSLGAEAADAARSRLAFAFSGCHRALRRSFAENVAWRNFHGAAVRLGTRGIVLAADPGAGKTTLALALAALGAELYTDEFVFVRRADRYVGGYLANPFLREPAVNALRLPRLRALCDARDGQLWQPGLRVWFDIEPTAIFARDVSADPAPLGGVVILGRDGAADALEPISPSVAAIELARRLHAPVVGFERLAEVAALTSGVPAFRLRVSEPHASARAVREALA